MNPILAAALKLAEPALLAAFEYIEKNPEEFQKLVADGVAFLIAQGRKALDEAKTKADAQIAQASEHIPLSR